MNAPRRIAPSIQIGNCYREDAKSAEDTQRFPSVNWGRSVNHLIAFPMILQIMQSLGKPSRNYVSDFSSNVQRDVLRKDCDSRSFA